MAQGRTWRNRLLIVLALSLYAFLVATEIAPNPLPALWAWVSQDRPLAAGLEWQDRLGAKPSSVTAAGDVIAVAAGRSGEVRKQSDGTLVVPLGGADRSADWVAVAGSGGDTVVVAGERMSKGYEVRDAGSGAVLHTDEEAVAVWTYRDALLDLRCDGPRSCELRRYPPHSGTPTWSTAIPGAGSVLAADNPELAGARTKTPSGVDPGISGPEPIPRVLGFAVGRREVAVVDTVTGQVLHELQAERNEQLSVIGGRIISSRATRRDGICVVSVTGYDAVTGLPAWGPEPYHLRTASGAGCEQRHAPVAVEGALVAVGPDGRELVIHAYDGRVLWTGSEGELVEALSPELAVIRAADRTVIYGVALGGSGDPLWEQAVHENAGVALARCGVVVVDRRPNRLRVWHPVTSEERLSVRTSARAAACTAAGLVLADGRSIGLARWQDGGTGEVGHDVDAPDVQK